MKGVILAGGTGSRLLPVTKVTNKHLLPIYNKCTIYYPIETLRDSGITELLIILGGHSVGEIVTQLSDGKELDVSITYRHQSRPDGIVGALKLARSFVGIDDFAVCLGDNIFEKYIPDVMNKFASNKIPNIQNGMVFLSPTDSPNRFGVPTFNADNSSIIKITEKPKNPETNFAVTGLYIYDSNVWNMIDSLKASDRGELEITDLNNWYINNGVLKYEIVDGWWKDAGNFDALVEANVLVRESVLSNVKK